MGSTPLSPKKGTNKEQIQIKDKSPKRTNWTVRGLHSAHPKRARQGERLSPVIIIISYDRSSLCRPVPPSICRATFCFFTQPNTIHTIYISHNLKQFLCSFTLFKSLPWKIQYAYHSLKYDDTPPSPFISWKNNEGHVPQTSCHKRFVTMTSVHLDQKPIGFSFQWNVTPVYHWQWV